MKVLQGTFHQGKPEFSYYGRQCCAISIVSCCYALKKHPSLWNCFDVDNCVTVSIEIWDEYCKWIKFLYLSMLSYRFKTQSEKSQ